MGKKRKYADVYGGYNGSKVIVELKYNKGATSLCFQRDDKTEYELTAQSAPDMLRILVAAEIQVSQLMADEGIPLPKFPDETMELLENDRIIHGIGEGKKHWN